MKKLGENKNARATESLADIGASILNAALSTFLAVAVLLFTSSYFWKTLAIQFIVTIMLGLMHGLLLLPVLLSLFGPEPFASAEIKVSNVLQKETGVANHAEADSSSSSTDEDSNSSSSNIVEDSK